MISARVQQHTLREVEVKMNRKLLAALVIASLSTACALLPNQQVQERAVQGPEFILEIANPLPHTMNLSYTIGGTVTALGSLAPNETKRWAIPNQGGDRVVIYANDPTLKMRHTKSLDLDKGEVVRWEIRD